MGTITMEVTYKRGSQTKVIKYEASGNSEDAVKTTLRKSIYGVMGWRVNNILQLSNTFLEVKDGRKTSASGVDDSAKKGTS